MYNEEAIIADTAKKLSAYMSENFDDYEIIFSNDGSGDGCGETVRELSLPCVRVIENKVNMGKGHAVRAAMLEADGDVVMFTDADLAYGTEIIGRIRDEFERAPQTQVLIGSRNLSRDGYDGYTFIRKVASKTYIKVLGIVGGFKLSDSQCGCKAFSGEAAKRIFCRCEVNRFAFDFEVLLWAAKLGMDICEIPVKIINHRASTVNVWRDSVRMLCDVQKMKKRIKKAQI